MLAHHENTAVAAPQVAPGSSGQLLPASVDTPRYVLSLTLPEFSMFNNAVTAGLARYGGSVEMNLTISDFRQSGSGPRWVVSMENAGALEAFSMWAAKELVSVVQESDLSRLDSASTQTMAAIGSLSRKIELAQKSPVWPQHVVQGKLQFSGIAPLLTTGTHTIRLEGKVDELSQEFDGRVVQALGSLRQPDVFHVDRLVPVTSNTLEVFTMSHCPFGQQVVPILARFVLEQKNNPSTSMAPRINVHYIFYQTEGDPTAGFFCLHGEEEMHENLVQMAIRDQHPHLFHDYLLARFTNPDATWNQLAENVGLTTETVAQIERDIAQNQNTMIEREYLYVNKIAGVSDKSPTYKWNGNIIATPQAAPPFQSFDPASIPAGACTQ